MVTTEAAVVIDYPLFPLLLSTPTYCTKLFVHRIAKALKERRSTTPAKLACTAGLHGVVCKPQANTVGQGPIPPMVRSRLVQLGTMETSSHPQHSHQSAIHARHVQ